MKRWGVALSRDYHPIAVREGNDSNLWKTPALYHDNYGDRPTFVIMWLRELGGVAVLFLNAPDELGAFVAATTWVRENHNETMAR